MNNSAAIGYMILAAKDIELDDETIQKLEQNMRYFMEWTTEEKAAETYTNFR